jgi:hypothetical protein
MNGRLEKMMRQTYANMVAYLLNQDMVDDALDRARIALHLTHEAHSSVGLSLLAVYFAGVAAERDRLQDAAVLLGHYLHAFHATYGKARELELTERNLHDRIMEKLRGPLEPRAIEQLLDAGAALTSPEVLERMLAIS